MRKVLPIILILTGLVLFGFGVARSIGDISGSLSTIGSAWQAPGTTTQQLQPGTYMVYENRGTLPSQMANPTLRAEDVSVTGAAGTVPTSCAYCASRTTVTLGNITYAGVASFTVDQAGEYEITVDGDGQEVVVGPALGATVGKAFLGFALAGMGALFALAGLAWLVVALVTGGDKETVQAAQPAAGVQGGWYPDPQDPAQWRWWDGRQWTDQRAPRS